MKRTLRLFALFLIIFSFTFCSENNDPLSPKEDHFEAEGMVLYNSLNQKVLDYFQGVSNDTLKLVLNTETDILSVKFYDENKLELDPPKDEHHTFGFSIDDPLKLEVIRITGEEWKFRLKGLSQGSTKIEFQIVHEGHPDFKTIKVPVVISTNLIQPANNGLLNSYARK